MTTETLRLTIRPAASDSLPMPTPGLLANRCLTTRRPSGKRWVGWQPQLVGLSEKHSAIGKLAHAGRSRKECVCAMVIKIGRACFVCDMQLQGSPRGNTSYKDASLPRPRLSDPPACLANSQAKGYA